MVTFLEHLERKFPGIMEKEVFSFDMDGTLTSTISGEVCANNADDIILLPNVRKALSAIKHAGKKVTIFTNQGGASWGFMREQDVWDILLTVNMMFDGVFDLIKVNCYHVKGKWNGFYLNKAKPKPILLDETVMELGTKCAHMVAIGNSPQDKKSAEASNIKFVWAHEFFGWPEGIMEEDSHGYKIRDEVLYPLRKKAILCAGR